MSEPDPSEESIVVFQLGRTQRNLLRTVLDSIKGVGDPDDDPAARRLYPAASSQRDVADEYAEMTATELNALRNADDDVLARVLDRAKDNEALAVTVAEADACVRAIGAARISMAARLGMFEKAKRVSLRQRAAVNFLAYVQDAMVTTLMKGMPDSGDHDQTAGPM